MGSKITALRCLLVRMTEGSPSSSTAEECTSATADNFIPAMAGTVISGKVDRGNSLVMLAKAAAPASAAVDTAASHHITILPGHVQDGRKSPPPFDSLVQSREKTPQPPPKEASLQYSPFRPSGHLFVFAETAYSLQQAASPLCLRAPDTWGTTGREPPSIPSIETRKPLASHLRSSNCRSCRPRSYVEWLPNGVHLKSSEVRAHTPPATAKPAGVSDPRAQTSLVSRSRPQSSSVNLCHPILAISNIHRPPRWEKWKRSVHL